MHSAWVAMLWSGYADWKNVVYANSMQCYLFIFPHVS